MDLELLAKVVAPAVGGAYTVYRLLQSPVRKALARGRLRDEHLGRIPDVLKELAAVRAELRTNGGTSLRDEIRRIGDRNAVNEQHIRAILQTDTAAPVFESRGDGEWTWVNRALMNLTSRSSEELLGNGWINSVDPADRTSVVDEWRHAIRDKRECLIQFRITTRMLKSLWVQLHAYPVHGVRGDEIVGYFGLIGLDAAAGRQQALDVAASN